MAESQTDETINFYKPLKRFIIPITNFHVPRKLFSIFKKQKYNFKINNNFADVIYQCQKIKRKEKDTWINEIILKSYIELNQLNKCHSVECYENNNLVGGLYGVHLGGCFFGESMFSKKTNTSKLCLLYLICVLKKNKFNLLDSQFYNQHLSQFGAYEITDIKYNEILNQSLKTKSEFLEIDNFQEALLILQSTNHKS